MTHIKAPYNFVPLNKKVVSPYWAPFVSHDVPFADSCSGTLKVTITAHSPIFVKNGMGQEEERTHFTNNVQTKPFRFNQDQNGTFFIPGSSIKGMVRSVLEAFSFGYLGRKVKDVRYSIRDFSPQQTIYNPGEIAKEVKCGWLKMENEDEYTLEEGGPIRRIPHSAIENEYSINGFAKTGRAKSAKAKFKKLPSPTPKSKFSSSRDKYGREICKFDPDGNIEGRLVVTGQPSSKKKKEFVFTETGQYEKVPKKVIENFFFAYYDHDKSQQSEDWKYWKKCLKTGQKIPVFFRRVKHNNKIKDIGLSMLYKIVYKNSVLESINFHQKNHKTDLSETIFGYISKGGNSLKGRVHIGHAMGLGTCEEGQEFQGVLATPKASYYPTYIRQKNKEEYTTFMNEGAMISGWKRYPVHKRGVKANKVPEKSTEKVLTRFIPLKEGAEFHCKIHYHNLKKIELGALLSALTFHNTENAFHTLGMAKPLGYGKVKLRIEGIEKPEEYLKAFECYMNVELENSAPEWHILDQIVELVTMAQEQNNEAPKAKLEYMKLGMRREDNEFNLAKNNKEALDKYSNLVEQKAEISPLSTPECITKMRQQCKEEENTLNRLKSLNELVPEYLEKKKKELEKKLEKRKSQLLEELRTRRNTLKEQEQAEKKEREAEERRKRKIAQQQKARSKGLILDEVDERQKKAFDHVKKIIKNYGLKYYNASEKELKENYPEGYLPESDHEELFKKLEKIFNALNKKEKEKWQKPYNKNAEMKKVAEWIGKEKAIELFRNLK